METYCSGCKKRTDNICPKMLVIMTNKKLKGKSRCVNWMVNKSYSATIKHKSERDIIVSQVLIN